MGRHSSQDGQLEGSRERAHRRVDLRSDHHQQRAVRPKARLERQTGLRGS